MLGKMFKGQSQICMLELEKLFNGTNDMIRFFRMVQEIDPTFYWIHNNQEQQKDQESQKDTKFKDFR